MQVNNTISLHLSRFGFNFTNNDEEPNDNSVAKALRANNDQIQQTQGRTNVSQEALEHQQPNTVLKR